MTQPISNLSVGSKVRFGKYQVGTENSQDIVWQIADKNHSGYPANSVTLITDKIIDLRGVDAKEPNNSNEDRQKYGNNRYKDSNLRQWLNKSGEPWFVKTHTVDEPPTDSGTNNYGTGYDNKKGFLNYFTDNELAAILNTNLTVAKNTVTDGDGTETVVDKFFLASVTEVGLANEQGGAEGSKLALFSDDNSRKCNLTEQCFNNTKSGSKPSTIADMWYWWLRSPSSSRSYYVRFVGSGGSLSGSRACDGDDGVRPLCNLKSEILVSDTPIDGAYNLIFATPHIITLDKPITIGAGEKLEKVKFIPKVNDTELDLKYTDDEKLVYEKDGLDTDTVDLEIDGKDGKIDNIAYTIS